MKNTTAKIRSKLLESFAKKDTAASPNLFSAVLIFFFSYLVSTGILVFQPNQGFEGKEYVIDEPVPYSYFSPVEFEYTNESATENLRQQKARETAPVLSLDGKVSKEKQQALASAFDLMQRAQQDPTFVFSQNALTVPLTEGQFRLLASHTDLEEIRKASLSLLEIVFSEGILEDAQKKELTETKTAVVVLVDKKEQIVPVKELASLKEVRGALEGRLPEALKKNGEVKNIILGVLNSLLAPNLFLDEKATLAAQKKNMAEVIPVQIKVQKNELIAQRGKLLRLEEKERLDQIQKKLIEHRAWNQLWASSAWALLSYLLCFFYVVIFEKRMLRSPKTVALVHVILNLTLLLCRTASLWPDASLYLMPSAAASLLLALLIHPRLAFLAAGMMAMLIAPMSAFSPDIILNVFVSGIAAGFAGLKIRKRSHFLQAGALIGLASFFILFIFRLYQEFPVRESFEISLNGFFNGFLITMPLCFILLPIFEHLFNLTTDITLLELSDLNHPLLKRMIVEAPGTYHHSLVVSTLAEGACQAIGANALLARVGCYFHDIGKVPRAEFFTENQHAKLAKHEKMTPTMSSLIILNHVKDGIELGKQYKLREPILKFIPEHQGTGVIYYFYRKALDQAKPGEKVNPDDFRYPGPKPQSRETAVALLSDSVEAASRSLKDPSPESIRQLVQKIINDKFIDGQLDECDITLRDLHKIQESFVYNLMAIFHTRVTYPAMKRLESDPDLFCENPHEKKHEDAKKPPYSP